VLHLSLLKRAMRFSLVSFNDILGRVVAVAVSIALAWTGWGYWALVAGVVAAEPQFVHWKLGGLCLASRPTAAARGNRIYGSLCG